MGAALPTGVGVVLAVGGGVGCEVADAVGKARGKLLGKLGQEEAPATTAAADFR